MVLRFHAGTIFVETTEESVLDCKETTLTLLRRPYKHILRPPKLSQNIWIVLTKELAQNDLSSIVKALLHTVKMHKAISQKRGGSPRGDIFREQFRTEILNV